MANKFLIVILVSCSVMFTACGHSKNVAYGSDPNAPTPPPPPPPTLPPRMVFVTATVTAVDTSFHTPGPPDAPNKYPRGVVMRIDSVTGYGMGIPTPVNIGQVISVVLLGPPPPPLPTMGTMGQMPPPPPPEQLVVMPGMIVRGMIECSPVTEAPGYRMIRYEVVH